jgi:hypothetical protein
MKERYEAGRRPNLWEAPPQLLAGKLENLSSVMNDAEFAEFQSLVKRLNAIQANPNLAFPSVGDWMDGFFDPPAPRPKKSPLRGGRPRRWPKDKPAFDEEPMM